MAARTWVRGALRPLGTHFRGLEPLLWEWAAPRRQVRFYRGGEFMPGEQPLLNQYFQIKNQYQDALVLFQVGGFYQAYYHDAALLKRTLGVKMLSRAVGGGERIPMCGVPVSAGPAYAEKLAGKGWRVVLCRQTEQRDERGMAVRQVEQVAEPPEGIDRLDLTGAWTDYLKAVPPEDVPAPQPRNRARAGAERGEGELLHQLRGLRLEDMTPMEALRLLYDWKRTFVGGPARADRLREDM